MRGPGGRERAPAGGPRACSNLPQIQQFCRAGMMPAAHAENVYFFASSKTGADCVVAYYRRGRRIPTFDYRLGGGVYAPAILRSIIPCTSIISPTCPKKYIFFTPRISQRVHPKTKREVMAQKVCTPAFSAKHGAIRSCRKGQCFPSRGRK